MDNSCSKCPVHWVQSPELQERNKHPSAQIRDSQLSSISYTFCFNIMQSISCIGKKLVDFSSPWEKRPIITQSLSINFPCIMFVSDFNLELGVLGKAVRVAL